MTRSTALEDEIDRLKWDIDAYRGALGYSVRGDHDGRLSDGTTPSNGIAEALCKDAARGRWFIEHLPNYVDKHTLLAILAAIKSAGLGKP